MEDTSANAPAGPCTDSILGKRIHAQSKQVQGTEGLGDIPLPGIGQNTNGTPHASPDREDTTARNDAPRTTHGQYTSGIPDTKAGRDNATVNTEGKQSYASLFKDNRMPTTASLLNYIDPPTEEIVIEPGEIDSVEDTFGFCLVGYVMGNRPCDEPY